MRNFKASSIRVDESLEITGEMNVLLIEGVAKGYYECPFTVKTGDLFLSSKKKMATEEKQRTRHFQASFSYF